MTPTQLEKIDMLDFNNFVVLNKFDKIGALDALKDVKKQYQNHLLFDVAVDSMPVYGTISSEFNNNGLNQFYYDLLKRLTQSKLFKNLIPKLIIFNTKEQLIPPKRNRYCQKLQI